MTDPVCPIVCIGASAGGLAPLERLFERMPVTTGAAFVVIQHLDPARASSIAEILSRRTTMPCCQIEDGMPVGPDRVFVIPPNSRLTLAGDRFGVVSPVARVPRVMPIDDFLTVLARACGSRAVAIILSGGGSDGAAGIQAINEHDGLVLAQAPASAEFDGMPRAAIATGKVDIVGPVEDMPGHITAFLEQGRAGRDEGMSEDEGDIAEERRLGAILALLRLQLGQDFRPYKRGTLRRRVARRMSLNRFDSMEDYVSHLRVAPRELAELLHDLLVTVTGFFRDPDAFDALERVAVGPIVAGKRPGEPIRVWVPGCASGEEAYSIAILFLDALRRARKNCPLQVFATDIDRETLNTGRFGAYPENIVTTMPPERLRRYFQKDDHVFRVAESLRESVTFAAQNVITDPPFSRIDLISCRNLLIYLKNDVQRSVLGYFHFGLVDRGFLFLGHSETVSPQETLFDTIDKKWRIFRQIPGTKRRPTSFPLLGTAQPVAPPGVAGVAPSPGPATLRDLVQQQLLLRFAPAAVLVNERHEVLYFVGPTARYLSQPTGLPTHDLIAMTIGELKPTLRAGLMEAFTGKETVLGRTAHLRRAAGPTQVEIGYQRLTLPGQREPLVLVTFWEGATALAREPANAAVEPAPEHVYSSALEIELDATREELQRHIEELEAANEELQAANEEVMSVNEELQSTNEELETSKEELQSMNEELTTVNNQLDEKVRELVALNDDLTNFVASTGIATVFLDTEQRILRFTPATKRLMNLIASDTGRPLVDIRFKFADDTLISDIEGVIETLQPSEREIVTEEGA